MNGLRVRAVSTGCGHRATRNNRRALKHPRDFIAEFAIVVMIGQAQGTTPEKQSARLASVCVSMPE